MCVNTVKSMVTILRLIYAISAMELVQRQTSEIEIPNRCGVHTHIHTCTHTPV